MTLASVGPAVRMAAADARDKLLRVLAAKLAVDPGTLSIEGGLVFRGSGEAPGIAIKDALTVNSTGEASFSVVLRTASDAGPLALVLLADQPRSIGRPVGCADLDK